MSGISVANLAGRDGGSGWGLKAEAAASPGTKLLDLPAACHLTYSAADNARLLRLIEKVPTELWGAKLALQVGLHMLKLLAQAAWIRPMGIFTNFISTSMRISISQHSFQSCFSPRYMASSACSCFRTASKVPRAA